MSTIHNEEVKLIEYQNPYWKDNHGYFLELLCGIQKNSRSFCITMKRGKNFQNIRKWIEDSTPKLSDKRYRLTTKIYWILHGFTDFPVCPQCGKSEGYENKNVVSTKSGYFGFCSVACTRNNKELNEKISDSIEKHFGVRHALQSNKAWEKYERTCLKRYRVRNAGCSTQAIAKMRKKYSYDSLEFDSAFELAFYIYMKDHHIDFKYNKEIYFEYVFNKKTYYYIPDFVIGGKIVELKGAHFFSNDEKMICPYRNKKWSDKRYAEECEKYHQKQLCMKNNNVLVIKDSSMCSKLIFRYIKEKYGRNFLNNFKKTQGNLKHI